MTTFGHRFLYKLNEWWREEGTELGVFFVEDNGTILVQIEQEFVGIIYWTSVGILTISLHPTYEHHQPIRLFLLRTLSAFLGTVVIRYLQSTGTYNI